MKPDKETLNLKYLLTTRRSLLMTVAIGLVSVLLVILVIIPQIQQSFTLWGNWRRELAARDQLQRKVAQLQQVSGDATADQAALVNTVLPSRKPVLELMSGLGKVAQQSNITFTSVQLSPGSIATESAETPASQTKTTKKNGKTQRQVLRREYETLDVSLMITGRLADINTFLEQVEKLAPATTITQLSLDKARKTVTGITAASLATDDSIPEEEIYEAELVIESYYFTKSISAALDASLPTIGVEEQALLEVFRTYTQGTAVTQDRIEGGGLNDLFGAGVEDLIDGRLEQLLNSNPTLPAASPTLTAPTVPEATSSPAQNT